MPKSKSKSSPDTKQPEMATIVLVRHATTPTTGTVLPGRKPGLHLSKKGFQEAEKTAQTIADRFPEALIYASPLERAQETAGAIAAALNKKVRTLQTLNECHFGSWTGKKLSALSKLPEWTHIQKSPGSFRFPRGESFLEMQARITEAVSGLAERHSGKTIVAVSHADPIKVALSYYLGMPLDMFQRIMISPASFSVLALPNARTGASPAVIALNISPQIPKQK